MYCYADSFKNDLNIYCVPVYVWNDKNISMNNEEEKITYSN